MSRPRTPEHFPRMKVRGGRRRHDAEIASAWRAVDTIDWGAISRAVTGFGETVVRVAEEIANVAQRVATGFVQALNVSLWISRQNRRNRWVATHQLPPSRVTVGGTDGT